MKVVFDENVPEPLRQFLTHHEVTTVQQQGWSGIGNGQLLQKVDRTFDVLLLADKNLRYQQNLANRQIELVELPTNRWPLLKVIAQRVVAAVDQARPGCYQLLHKYVHFLKSLL
jgi:hypothetical protein